MPEALIFVYRGQICTLRPLRDPSGSHQIGYWLKCSRCDRGAALEPPDHVVTVDAEGRPTVAPSIVCPHGCGWHVVLKDGVARDA